MITEKSNIQNECIYSNDKTHRYLLSRIWDKDKPIALFVTKNAGNANGICIELTNNIITNNLYNLGYGGYYAVNLYSSIYPSDTMFDKTTDDIIKKYSKLADDVIISWGTITTKALQKRENDVLNILSNNSKNLLTVSDSNGHINIHPLTPSVRKGFYLTKYSQE